MSELIYCPVKKSAFVLLALTLFAAGNSTAMSLGQHRGSARIGQALDISVQAVVGAQDGLATLCIEADAFYADNKLDKSLVKVSAEKALSNPLDATIRIQSSVLVDKPVVTLHVRVGCQQKIERRYVVASDTPPEPVTQVVPVQAPATSRASVTSAALPAGASSRTPEVVGKPAVAVSSSQDVPTAKINKPDKQDKSDKPRIGEADASNKATGAGARLQLEPIDSMVERDPQLKSSSELLTAPAVGEQPGLAAAALWRVLLAQPQDILRDAEKLQLLENSLNTMRVQSQKDKLALEALNRELEALRSQQYARWLVYVLAALVLVVLTRALYFWRQRRVSGNTAKIYVPWWRKNKSTEKSWNDYVSDSVVHSLQSVLIEENRIQMGRETAASSPVQKKTKPEPLRKPERGLSAGSNTGLDSHLKTALSKDAFTAPVVAPAAVNVAKTALRAERLSIPPALHPSDFTVSALHVARTAKVEELFDLQQKVDFFVSLGQQAQAVDILRAHILYDTQTSPLVYLNLFSIYHQLHQPNEYETLRQDFYKIFSVKISKFELHTGISSSLEAYPITLSRIEALWPSPKVLEVIVESILRRSITSADSFDLKAYRELLLLYAVAKDVHSLQTAHDVPHHFGATVTAPTPSAQDTKRALATDGVVASHSHPLANKPIAAKRQPVGSMQKPLAVRDDVGVDIALGVEPVVAAVTAASSLMDAVSYPEPELPPQNLAVDTEVELDIDFGVGVDDVVPKTSTPSTQVASSFHSNFFARLGTKIPGNSLSRSAPVADAVVVAPADLANEPPRH